MEWILGVQQDCTSYWKMKRKSKYNEEFLAFLAPRAPKESKVGGTLFWRASWDDKNFFLVLFSSLHCKFHEKINLVNILDTRKKKKYKLTFLLSGENSLN